MTETFDRQPVAKMTWPEHMADAEQRKRRQIEQDLERSRPSRTSNVIRSMVAITLLLAAVMSLRTQEEEKETKAASHNSTPAKGSGNGVVAGPPSKGRASTEANASAEGIAEASQGSVRPRVLGSLRSEILQWKAELSGLEADLETAMLCGETDRANELREQIARAKKTLEELEGQDPRSVY